MTAFVDSQAVLESRIKHAGLSDDIKDKLIAGGIVNMSQLAFISSYTPGSGDETPLIAAFEALLTREASVAEKASFRRVFNESYAAVTSQMRQQVERIDDTASRKLTQPERNDRYMRQCNKLVGVAIKGITEPADSLVDFCCNVYEDNRLRYIEWDRCLSKEQEMQSDSKKVTAFSLDSASGKLKIENKLPDDKADTSTDILLLQALTRRSLAMDQANLVEYSVIQSWVDRLMRARTDEAPGGFTKPSLKQLMAADQKLFMEMADRSRSGVQVTPAGRPLDDIVNQCKILNEVTCLMQPMPAAASKEMQSVKPGPYRETVFKGPGKSKGKGKNKTARMPADLVGCRSHTNSGQPICYGFNLGTCQEAVKDGRCSKGFHICAVPKCGKHHPAKQCPQWKSQAATS